MFYKTSSLTITRHGCCTVKKMSFYCIPVNRYLKVWHLKWPVGTYTPFIMRAFSISVLQFCVSDFSMYNLLYQCIDPILVVFHYLWRNIFQFSVVICSCSLFFSILMVLDPYLFSFILLLCDHKAFPLICQKNKFLGFQVFRIFLYGGIHFVAYVLSTVFFKWGYYTTVAYLYFGLTLVKEKKKLLQYRS